MSNRYDEIKEVEKFNPYHDSAGKFTSGSGGNVAHFTTQTKDPKKQHWADMAVARAKEQSKAPSAAAAKPKTETKPPKKKPIYEDEEKFKRKYNMTFNEVKNYGMTPKQWAQLADSDANPLD